MCFFFDEIWAGDVSRKQIGGLNQFCEITGN